MGIAGSSHDDGAQRRQGGWRAEGRFSRQQGVERTMQRKNGEVSVGWSRFAKARAIQI